MGTRGFFYKFENLNVNVSYNTLMDLMYFSYSVSSANSRV